MNTNEPTPQPEPIKIDRGTLMALLLDAAINLETRGFKKDRSYKECRRLLDEFLDRTGVIIIEAGYGPKTTKGKKKS
jgi:hypothetical protein